MQLHDETWKGLLHCQIIIFARLAQKAIDDADYDLWQEISNTFLTLWLDCNSEVTNALNVSFLEHLNFRDGKKLRSWAYSAMPSKMRTAWDSMEAYNQQLYKK